MVGKLEGEEIDGGRGRKESATCDMVRQVEAVTELELRWSMHQMALD